MKVEFANFSKKRLILFFSLAFMLTMKVNKSLCVAGAVCALAMNVNTAQGITEEEFNEKRDHLRTIQKSLDKRYFDDLAAIVSQYEIDRAQFYRLKGYLSLGNVLAIYFLAKRAGFPDVKSDEALAIYYLLRLGYTPDAISKIKQPRTKIIEALGREWRDITTDGNIMRAFEILEASSLASWSLDLVYSNLPSDEALSKKFDSSLKLIGVDLLKNNALLKRLIILIDGRVHTIQRTIQD